VDFKVDTSNRGAQVGGSNINSVNPVEHVTPSVLEAEKECGINFDHNVSIFTSPTFTIENTTGRNHFFGKFMTLMMASLTVETFFFSSAPMRWISLLPVTH